MIRRTLPLLAALGLAAGVAGCGRDNRGSVAMTAMCFPSTPDSTTGACSLQATCTAVLANGALWVNLGTTGGTLEYPIQIDNERPNNADVPSGRTNTAYAIIERFDMKYQATGFTLPSAFASQTVTVPASGTTVAEVQLIPAATGVALAAVLPAGPTDVLVEVSAHGRYGDDSPFDTAPYQVPVSVTVGPPGPLITCTNSSGIVSIRPACPQQGQTSVLGACLP
ncbi:hypothetical protein [Anaeromyxobacter diazotrophicus]|uniref:Lipoprotein n=1 Tax=Anaeromyxobacter diazotrophicus TaxID=2590199 RepID=A0A7I9VGW2_9BACT|nr:hypothetical protein [Anaeromyxobacter diazotrophicus]GEJ55633.1 hypothetical protein AMYX_03740 [Anaeromyxobacter diazotrophicus]